MKKKLSVLLALVFVFAFCLPVASFAKDDGETQRVIDNAGLLTEKQKKELNDLLNEYSEDSNCDFVIFTIEQHYGDDDKYAFDYQEEHAKQVGMKNAFMFFINMDDGYGRYYNFFGWGKGEDAFEDPDETFSGSVDHLREEDYYLAFKSFADTAHDEYNAYLRKSLIIKIIVALVIGLIAAWIGTSSMKAKLKTVAPKSNAADYVRSGSLNLTDSRDVFLYSNTVRTPRASENSRSGGGGGGYSSSGSHHSSGRGGHF